MSEKGRSGRGSSGAAGLVRWYSISEAAAYLGVSQPTIFRWMKQGSLSFNKIGGATRFSRENLDAVVEKNTGSKEADGCAARCASCGHTELADGQLQGIGNLYFRPARARFWVLEEALVPTRCRVCTACGYVQLHADTAKLRRLIRRDDDRKEGASDADRTADPGSDY